MLDKLITYLGFAIKSGNIVYGVDNIESKEKKVVLAIFDDSLSSNSCNKLYNIASRSHIELYNIDDNLERVVGKRNCKAVGIMSKDLAKAIKELNILKEVRN